MRSIEDFNMLIRKRNEYLDADDSDEDNGLSSDREVTRDSRIAGLKARTSKKQKLSTTDPQSDGGSGVTSPEDVPSATANIQHHEGSPDGVASMEPVLTLSPPHSILSATKRNLITKTPKPSHKPGVIYLSRIPPFMRPSTVKTLLSTYGPISKIFLTPEPPTTYLRRKKGGGNKKHSFIDGWVEFTKKKHAKQCVDAINGQIVGGRKGGWYRDDVWNARYLRGFGWSDLMQSVRAEEREREEKVRVGTKREGRERGEFLRNLERSKMEETRREKRRKRGEGQSEKLGDGNIPGNEVEGTLKEQNVEEGANQGKRKGFERRFRQNEVKANDTRQPEQSDDVKRVLSKIF